MAFLPQLVDWVSRQTAVVSSSEAGCAMTELSGRVDVQMLAVVGHSRGAKLAALVLAGGLMIYLED